MKEALLAVDLEKVLPAIVGQLDKAESDLEELNATMMQGGRSTPQEARKYGELRVMCDYKSKLATLTEDLASAKGLCDDDDEDVRAMAAEEVQGLESELWELTETILAILAPADELDTRSVVMEIRAGTGGAEASLFAADLMRMYMRWCEETKMSCEVTNLNEGEHSGVRYVSLIIEGDGAFGELKGEAGVHRVQRVPLTETSGRLHTSTCSVAVMPKASKKEEVELDPSTLRVDTYRASGAGGQHVNKTDSAVRITHLPTGLAVECQSDRSQHKNKANAIAMLAARLSELERESELQQQNAERRDMIGTAQRSEKIRTYNFPQSRVTDHRVNFTTHRLEHIMQGELAPLIQAFKSHTALRHLQIS